MAEWNIIVSCHFDHFREGFKSCWFNVCFDVKGSQLLVIVLENLFTLPSHGRRGCGHELTKVIFPRVDAENGICYLDASPMGYAVYLRCGFVEVDVVEIDKGEYGGSGIHQHVGMLRYRQMSDLELGFGSDVAKFL